MNKEDFVTYEQAKALKELGFDWECNHWYHPMELDKLMDCISECNHNGFERPYSAPTLAQTAKWLRETKRIHLWVEPEPIEFLGEVMYIFYILDENRWLYPVIEDEKCYNTYEEALSEGIDVVLKTITNTKN